MNIQEYSKYSKKPYHFESSNNFCDLKKIEKARSIVLKKLTIKKVELKQLEAIVRLEKIRYKLAIKEIELNRYKELVKNIDSDFFKENNFDVFENTKVHDEFYFYLNEEYK